MIIQFVKDEGLPVVVWPPAHAVTIQKEDLGASETICELQFCVVKKTNFTSVFPEVIPSPRFGMCGYTDLDRKSLHILQTESQSINSFFLKNEKLLVAI